VTAKTVWHKVDVLMLSKNMITTAAHGPVGFEEALSDLLEARFSVRIWRNVPQTDFGRE
jgi:hypothetical protein